MPTSTDSVCTTRHTGRARPCPSCTAGPEQSTRRRLLFSNAYRVIAPEQMGHGRTTDDPGRPFHYHDMAEDTVELLRQLEIDSTFVFGFSDGGILGDRCLRR